MHALGVFTLLPVGIVNAVQTLKATANTPVHLAAYDQSLMVAVWCVLGLFGAEHAAAVHRLSATVRRQHSLFITAAQANHELCHADGVTD
jgi:hypothetical protein